MADPAIESHARRVLDEVVRAGAHGDLIVHQDASLSLKAHDGDLEEHKVNSTRVYGVRVIKDCRAGIAYSEAADAAALHSMVAQALQNAAFAREDDKEAIADGNGSLVTDDATLCRQDDVTVETKIAAALAMERELAARDKVQNVPYNGVQDVTAERYVFTTAGHTAHSKARLCNAYAYALLKDGDKDVLDGVERTARQFDELDTSVIVEETYARCIALLHGEAVPSRHYDVLFDVECQAALFDAFASVFSGRAARDGISPLRERIGERIGVDGLDIRDAPRRTEGFGYALFDGEGIATATTTLVERGRLVTLAHNSATAGHFGVANTGHAARSPKTPLGVALHQPEIGPGEIRESDLTSGEYLEIVDLAGLHSGTNAVSGDFSLGAAGFLCADGERLRPVRNITVAGNFLDMLTKIVGIGDVQHWNARRSALMARIRFADMPISG
ncbi:MAG: TldD/PmbA family protein [Gammaproteobacteria bacterium]|nr:TldD/PmbA family protein [Gammaproteobacteria bacterium]